MMREIADQTLNQAWCNCRPARVVEDAPCSNGLDAGETKQCGASLSHVRAPSVLSQASPSMPSQTPKRRRARRRARKVFCAACINIESALDSDKQLPVSCRRCQQLERDRTRLRMLHRECNLCREQPREQYVAETKRPASEFFWPKQPKANKPWMCNEVCDCPNEYCRCRLSTAIPSSRATAGEEHDPRAGLHATPAEE